MALKNWSTTPANNNSAPPNGWPEGQAPSTVNDCARQMMADLRTQWEGAEWFDYGDVVTRTTNTTFTIPTDVTTKYPIGVRLKLTDSSTLYGTVTAVNYSSPNTTVTVVLDSGTLSASLSAVARAILSPSNKSIPINLGYKGADLSSASTVNLAAASGDFVDITGTTTITSFGIADAGIARTVRFTGVLTLTHNAVSLILPNASNITTSSGDIAIFRSIGLGNWVCVNYSTTVSKTLDFIGSALQGSIIYRGTTAWTILSPGLSGSVLTSNGLGNNPSWGAFSSATLNGISYAVGNSLFYYY